MQIMTYDENSVQDSIQVQSSMRCKRLQFKAEIIQFKSVADVIVSRLVGRQVRHDFGSVDRDATHPRSSVETRNSLRQNFGHRLLECLHEKIILG